MKHYSNQCSSLFLLLQDKSSFVQLMYYLIPHVSFSFPLFFPEKSYFIQLMYYFFHKCSLFLPRQELFSPVSVLSTLTSFLLCLPFRDLSQQRTRCTPFSSRVLFNSFTRSTFLSVPGWPGAEWRRGIAGSNLRAAAGSRNREGE